MKTTEQRFWEKVEKTDACWVWHGANSGKVPHGIFFYKGKLQPAHRVSYEWAKGPIPNGLHIDHLCRNPPCVNPAHLEAVTPRENILRGEGTAARNFKKTHCINGHLLKGSNIYKRDDHFRVCKVCATEKSKEISEALGPSRSKEHCINGHKYTKENTRINRLGYRVCIACHRKTANLPASKDRTKCKHGHAYTKENTYINPRGIKECVSCRRQRDALRCERISDLDI